MPSTLSSPESCDSASTQATSVDPAPSSTHYHFVVAGGSYAAVSAVRIICKHVIPQAVAANPCFRARITVIAPNKEAYWNIAAVRLISQPELLKTHGDQIFFPLEESLRKHLPKAPKYTAQHELDVIQGKIMTLNSQYSSLTYLKLTNDDKLQTFNDFLCNTITFDRLILATGASSSSPAFKLNGSTDLTRVALQELQESTSRASNICIVGAGGVGVELAGELGHKYGKSKKIQLYSAFDGALGHLKTRIADDAVVKLKQLGVETVTNARAVSARPEILKPPTSPASLSLECEPSNVTIVSSEDAATSPTSVTPQTLPQGQYKKEVYKHSPKPKRPHTSLCLLRWTSSKETLSSRASSKAQHSSPLSRSSTLSSDSSSSDFEAPKLLRTEVTFENGYKEAYDCYIPTTGNVPNSKYLPFSCLDANGYVLTDPYLRLASCNPHSSVYVYGDIVSGCSQTLADLSEGQKHTLKATLMHDLFATTTSASDQFPLKPYKPSPVTYYVPISRKGGVGQMFGLAIPGFVVSIMKGKNFRINESKAYLSTD